jgi:aryl-alcohol dehydrogenase-like predicted oxidoreductase
MYGAGHNESVLGRWFAANPSRRNEIFLATKFGCSMSADRLSVAVDDSPENLRRCVEASLKRLGVERIDLLYAHRIDTKIPIEVTVDAMAELVKEGKVRYLGLSECSAQTLRRANKVHPIAAAQMEFSPFALDLEDPSIGVLEAARQCGT